MAKRIFIIEDDDSVQDILRLVFEKAGYELEFSSDGQSVYQLERWPDLFLLDKHIRGYDGIDICKFIKTNPNSRHIPVIMISATPGIEPFAMEAGADGFVEKPFNTASLMSVVKSFIG